MSGVSIDPPPLTLPSLSDPPPPGSRTVTTDDGVPLHVEVDGDETAPVTVVFSHGFTARLAEPPPLSTRAAALWPVIVQLERTSDAVTEAVIATEHGEPAPDLTQVAVLRRAIRELEDDIRTHRPPDDTELHAEGVLAPVAREVDAARRLVRDAAPGRPRAGAG